MGKLSGVTALMRDLGEGAQAARQAIVGLVPIAKILRRAGVQLDEFVSRVEQGDSPREALCAFVAAEVLADAGVGGDEQRNRHLAARYLRAMRERARADAAAADPADLAVEAARAELDAHAPPPPQEEDPEELGIPE